MSRIFFFIAEGFRALRRSAAPSLAAIVTVGVTMLVLGVLIPVLQVANDKNEEVREPGRAEGLLRAREGADPNRGRPAR